MHIKERYKEILFINDTCEAFTLFDYVDVPNVFFVASSMKDQKSQSYSYDVDQMTPTTDKFHFRMYENFEKVYKEKNFDLSIEDMFKRIKAEREFLNTDVMMKNSIKRRVKFEDFFGNYLRKNYRNEKLFDIKIDDEDESEEDPVNEMLLNKLKNVNDEVHKIKKYKEVNFAFSN